MRWNVNEVAALAHQPPEWEGRLMHRDGRGGKVIQRFSNGRSGEFKERWVRLRANCLFYWRHTNGSAKPALGSEPLGVLILETSHAQQEGFTAESAHAFSVIFDDGSKHIFLAESDRHVQRWLSALKKTRYEAMRSKLISLQTKICNRTGRNPLLGTGFDLNPIYNARLATSSTSSAHAAAAVEFAKGESEESPKPKPRKSKSTFQSHITENWESHSPLASRKEENTVDGKSERRNNSKSKPSFKSHVVATAEGSLVDLS